MVKTRPSPTLSAFFILHDHNVTLVLNIVKQAMTSVRFLFNIYEQNALICCHVYFVDLKLSVIFDVCFFYKVHVLQQKPPSKLQKEI